MNFSTTYPEINEAAGLWRQGEVTLLYTDEASPETIEVMLAHEFTHSVQPSDLDEQLKRKAESEFAYTFDTKLARRSVTEGAATYVADVYARRYLDGPSRTETLCVEWERMPPGEQAYWVPYCSGSRYVSDHVNSPGQLTTMYENAPVTMEQVLHGYDPIHEPRRNLTVRTTSNTSKWDLTRTDTLGEWYLRSVLTNDLPAERAEQAAAGWGNDELLTFYNVSRVGHAWIVRWDDPANASEFESTFATYLSQRATQEGKIWYDETAQFRVTSITADTVVVFAGDPAFVANASAAGRAGNVTVRTE